MRVKTRAMAAAAITSFALLATACGGGGGETPDPGSSEPAGTAGGEIRINGCTPKAALIPGNTSETCGGDMVEAMTSKLVRYNTETAAPENGHRRVDRVRGQHRPSPSSSSRATSSTTAPTSRPRTSSTHGTTSTTDRTARPAATSTRPSRATATCSAAPTPTARPTARAAAQGEDTERPEGRGRHHVHHQDHRDRSPTCRCAWATRPSLRCRTPSSPIPKAFEDKPIGAGPVQVRQQVHHRVRPLQVRRVLRRRTSRASTR